MITKREIAIILIRVLAAYMLLQALSILPMSVAFGTSNPVLFLLSHEFSTFVISAVLWFAAPRLSSIIVRDITGTTESIESITDNHLEALIFSGIGLVLVATSIPAIANMIAYNSAIETLNPDAATKVQMIASSKGFTAKYIAKIACGLFLLVFSEKLYRLLSKIRKKV
jgi:hypothetical protein